MTTCSKDHLELRSEFNSRVKARYKETHTPQCKKCMRFHPWGNSIMEVHHIIALIDGGTNDEDNLVTLCYECHREWHNHFDTDGADSFKDWMQRVPLYIYSAIGMSSDKELKKELFSNIDDMWPAVRNMRSITEPYKDGNAEYVRKNSMKWIDW